MKTETQGKPQNRLASGLHSQRGISLVESALVSVFVLIPLLIGVIDFGRAYFLQIEVTNAARAAVQFGAQNTGTLSDTADIQNAAYAEAPDISTACSGSAPCWVSVNVTTGCECSNNTGTGTNGSLGTPYTATACTAVQPCGASGHLVLFVYVQCQAQYTPILNFMGILPPTITLGSQAKMRLATQ